VSSHPLRDDEARDERERLGAAVRALVDRVVRTAAGADELREITERIDELSRRLEAAGGKPRGFRGAFRHDVSLVGGPAHPVAPQLVLTPADRGVAGTVIVGAVFEGAPGLVHGGIVSLLFDHAMGQAALAAGYGPMTVSLTVNYQAPTPLEVPLRVAAWLDRVEGRKLFLAGEITADGTVCATSEGVFVQLTRANVAAIFPQS
jgi:acyl-coenzyme A thioesterase PaaI-like protein